MQSRMSKTGLTGRDNCPHRHLLGMENLQPWEIRFLLDEAEHWVAINRQSATHDDRLAGLTQMNAFFENSPRTMLPCEVAGKRRGAAVVNIPSAQSSAKQGETRIDTAVTMNPMRADLFVIRHNTSR